MFDFKRIIIIFVFIILLIIGLFVIYNFFINNKEIKINEIIPEQEISEEQMRNTMVTLYFKLENNLVPELRLIDVKELLNDPYNIILKMLIDGPKNNKLEKVMPESTKINSINKIDDVLIIDLSEDFINNNIKDKEENISVKSILYTLTELKEINKIKILINGEKNNLLKDEYFKE